MPLKFLRVFDQYSNLQYHHLKRLQIIPGPNGLQYGDGVKQPLPLLLNPTASPPEVAICEVPFRSLKISWTHLFIASVADCELEDISQLLQHAPQMTECDISSPKDTQNFSMPPINHRKLTKLSLSDPDSLGEGQVATLLGSLTLPNLQTFCTSETCLLSPEHLFALIRRSSCSLTRIELFGSEFYIYALEALIMQPLPGVTDLLLDTNDNRSVVENLLFQGYFPHLRHLTIPPYSLSRLKFKGILSALLDRQRPWPNGRRLHKIIIEEETYDGVEIWQIVEKDLKGMDVRVTESRVEIFCAGEDD